MVTPRTGRPRGRPKESFKPFLEDPDRFVIAFAMTFEAIGLSGRKAFTLAAALFEGREVKTNEKDVALLKKRRPDLQMITFERMSSLADRAIYLQKKAGLYHNKRVIVGYDATEARWIRGATSAILIAFGALRFDVGKLTVTQLCEDIHEPAFGDLLIMSFLGQRFGVPD